MHHFRPPAAGQPLKQTVVSQSVSQSVGKYVCEEALRRGKLAELAISAQVFIAARALHDEELFLDYKLREDGPLEPWYCPVQGRAPT